MTPPVRSNELKRVCLCFGVVCADSDDQDFVVVSSEYEVISTAKGPDGEQVSILTTNQTHTAVENLKPESR